MARSAAPTRRKPAGPPPRRWGLLRDLLVFQAKLAFDGLRDLLLSPISLIAAIADLLARGERPGRYFYDLMHLGRRSDAWINLFGAGDRLLPREALREPERPEGVDRVFDRLEERIVEQYRKGGATASAKRAVDRALDTVQRAPRGRGHPDESS